MMMGKLTRKRRAKCQFYAAMCYFQVADFKRAEKSLTLLVEKFTAEKDILDLNFQALAHTMRAQAYQTLNRYNKAIHDFNRAAELAREKISID
jgi:tetratricopeptide (TPR) repeat protein